MSSLVLGYSEKWKSKTLIKRALTNKLKSNDKVNTLDPKNPLIDLIDYSIFGGNGKWATPEEYRKHAGKNIFTFTNRKRSFFGTFTYNPKTKNWSVK